jgi:ATP-binding cassette subfamily B (MDR/TAP) protein 1
VVLSDATFFFPAGETTFIVGKSGSGKSTLGNILLKYYEATSGTILVDGQSIQTLDLDWVRKNITLVQQQSVLFNETLFRNIAFGRSSDDKVTWEDIDKACQVGLLQEMIHDLPDGLDTQLDAHGNGLSGGQKQRIAIARARLRDAPILILDEATSALDYISRSSVMNAIRKWRKDKTTIIITHDISQIADEDYVYVLDQAKVVQQGYRKALGDNSQGPFAAFLPVTTESEEVMNPMIRLSTASDDIHPHEASPRASMETTQSGGSNDLSTAEVTGRLQRLSNIFVPTGQPSSSFRTFRSSYGFASVYSDVLHLKGDWRSGIDTNLVDDIIRPSFSPFGSLPPETVRSPSLIPAPYFSGNRRGSAVSSGKMSTLPLQRISMTEEILPAGSSDRLEAMEMLDYKRWRIQTQNQPPISRISTSFTPSQRKSHMPSTQPVNLNKSQPSIPKSYKKKATPIWKILRTVWPNLPAKDRTFLIIGFLCAFIHAAATPAFAYIFAQLLNIFYQTGGQNNAARTWSLYILGIALVDSGATYYQHYLLEHCGQAWINRLRVEAFSRILNQPRSWFGKEKNEPSRLSECLDRNAEEMRNLIGRFAGGVFVATAMITIAIVWSFIVCWKLTIVALASSPFIYGVTRGFEYASSKWECESNEAANKANSVFSETFTSIRVVRALTLEAYFQSKYEKTVQETYKVGKSRAFSAGLFFGLSDSSSLFITALIFYYGAVLVGHDGWKVESVITVISLMLFGITNATAIIAFIPQISSSRVTASHMLHLANLPYRASHEHQGTKRLATPLPICLQGLSFTYPSRPNVHILHNISITFQPGSCTAIVGPSGSGKSTIASLILNLYPPGSRTSIPRQGSRAALTFAGTSVMDCQIFGLRASIAIVSQSPILFPTSVSENIAYGLNDWSEWREHTNIEHAARQADIHDFIMSLPDGYATQIGEGGQGLSGGQSQRIAIARALVRRPAVLILDEATSALDSESADMIRETVSRLTRSRGGGGREGMAVIIITHNVEMMCVAERIVMLEHGRVVEEGSYKNLIRARGKFASLVRAGV